MNIRSFRLFKGDIELKNNTWGKFKGKFKGKYIVILLVVTLLVSLVTYISINIFKGSKQLTKRMKVQDFEYMYDVINESYPYLEVNKRVNNIDWLSKKDIYLEKIKNTKNDEEFIAELSNILSELNNDHTHLINNSYLFNLLVSNYEKLGWYNFSDDKAVKRRYENLGEKINNNKTISNEALILKDVVEDKVGYIFLPQMMPRNKQLELDDIEEDIKEISDYIKTLENHKAIIIDIRGNSGGSDQYWIEVISRIIHDEYNMGGYILFRDSKIMNDYIKVRNIEISSIEDLPKEIVKSGPPEITKEFKYFIESKRPVNSKDSINFKGKIFLLVDNSVYSSSESFSIFCKENGIATLIGETTSGDGGGYDPVLFKLKNSGLIVRMAGDMYLTDSAVCNEESKTVPDYIIENPKRTKDFSEDACINKALELID